MKRDNPSKPSFAERIARAEALADEQLAVAAKALRVAASAKARAGRVGPSFAERIARAEARSDEQVAAIVKRPIDVTGAHARTAARTARFKAASDRILAQIEELRRVTLPPAEPTPLDAAIQRFAAQINRLRGAPRSAKDSSPSATRVHDLEPVLLLMTELEGRQPELRSEGEQQLAWAEEWERRAMLAVNLGSDDLAREALERRRGCLTWAARHRGDLEAIELFLGTIRSFVDQVRGVPE
jgi:hypothetical protein